MAMPDVVQLEKFAGGLYRIYAKNRPPEHIAGITTFSRHLVQLCFCFTNARVVENMLMAGVTVHSYILLDTIADIIMQLTFISDWS